MTMLDLIVAVLCAYRLTQLLVWDSILSRPTNWLAGRSAWFAGLINCAHCMGFWCSVLTAGLLYLVHIGWWPVRYVLYAFGIAGAISIIEHYTGWLVPPKPKLPDYGQYPKLESLEEQEDALSAREGLEAHLKGKTLPWEEVKASLRRTYGMQQDPAIETEHMKGG